MKFQKFCLVCCFFLFPFFSLAQTKDGLVARFYFNKANPSNDLGAPAKAVGISYGEDRFGNPGSACCLTGSSESYLNLGTSPVLKPREGTISLWVKMANEIHAGQGYQGNPIILTKNHAGDDFYEAYYIGYGMNNKRIVLSTTESSTNQLLVIAADPFKIEEWHHIVMTYSDKSMCLYIDGKLQGCVNKNFRTNFLVTDSVMVGNTANLKNNRFFAGFVDDINIYNRVLSQEEILQLYNEPDPNKYHVILKITLIVLLSLLGISGIVFWLTRKFKKELEKEKEKSRLQRQMYEMEMNVIKAQMNPHFIFNAINSIYNFVLTGDRKSSAFYISRFASLIRNVLEFTSKKKITLEQELETLRLYMDIEQLRFRNPFEYEINLDPDLHPSSIMIAPLLVQPYVENAIWHGFSPKEGKGKLLISIKKEKNHLSFTIDDDGVGRVAATKNRQAEMNREPLGTQLNQRRLAVLSELYGNEFNVQFIDKELPDGTKTGTRVILNIPLLPNSE